MPIATSLKLIHTADWHLGQMFYEFDRTSEHRSFLNWLIETVVERHIDVLLISGDVFDTSNPSAATMQLYYKFLRDITSAAPGLQIIITAGNHDSAARLEAPSQLLEAFNINVIGTVPKQADGNIDYAKICIPLKNKSGEVAGICLAIPFLRNGDYPVVEKTANTYAAGVSLLYKNAFEYANSIVTEHQSIIALGHLHTLDAEILPDDKSERAIMGGVEFIPASAFDERLTYTALGHIHKAQRIAKRENVRYSGSPIPMSFSELNYKHQVIYFELQNQQILTIQPIEVPVLIPLLSIPSKPKILSEVLLELQKLEELTEDINLSPYLEVKVLLDGPEPTLRHHIEKALEHKKVRLARIHSVYPQGTMEDSDNSNRQKNLSEIEPLTMLQKVFQRKYQTDLPHETMALFLEVTQEIAEL